MSSKFCNKGELDNPQSWQSRENVNSTHPMGEEELSG